MNNQLGFTIWSEKIPEKGEDAKPTFVIQDNKEKFALAVYDGMGGAGSALYNYEDKSCSGAYIAANETKKYFEKQIGEYMNIANQDLSIVDSFENDLYIHLQSLANEIDKNPSRLKSNLIKRLPTTMAAIICETNSQTEEQNITCLWAGDSRCYILTSTHGLIQLSYDDIKGQDDALKNLRNDAPMSNYCNADFPFKINKLNIPVRAPFIVFVATDGCFGYLQSPFHFENLILKTLMSEYSKNAEDWKKLLIEEIHKVTGDDYSMALYTFGFESFVLMQDQFDTRASIIQNDFVSRYSLVEQKEFESKVNYEQAIIDKNQVLEELWSKYKANYYNTYVEGRDN